MKLATIISLILASIFLLSCTHDKTEQVPATIQKHLWICDTGTMVEWQAEDMSAKKIQLRVDGSQKLYILDKVYKTDIGTLYSNGELAFRVKDQAGELFWATNDEIIGQNCKTN